MKTRIELVIDELVLEGFAPADRYAIGEALSLELERLVAAGNAGEFTRPHIAASLRAGSISLAAGAPARMIGSQVARSVHASLRSSGPGGAG